MSKPVIDLDSPAPKKPRPGATPEKFEARDLDRNIRFNPKAIEFDLLDTDIEFIDALHADPYHNATSAWLLVHPHCDSHLAAKVNASALLKTKQAQAYVQWLRENSVRPTIVSREFVMLRLRHVAERAMAVSPVMDKDGQPTGEYKCDFGAANKALELLGKQLGMFKEKTELKIKGDRPTLNVTIMGLPDEADCPTTINDNIKE